MKAIVVLKGIFFGSASVALFTAGQHVLGLAYVLLFVLSMMLVSLLEQ
jgi:hypothetical protein